MLIASLLLAAALATPPERASVHGTVVVDDLPLPGVFVMLEAGVKTRTVVTDAHGEYRLVNVPTGDHVITFELDGFSTEHRTVPLGAGENEVPMQAMRTVTLAETFTVSCSMPCDRIAEGTPGALPSCADYDLNQSLMTSGANGDPSAWRLLRERHARTISLYERFRIDEALIRAGDDDPRFWNELLEHGRRGLRFHESREPVDPELEAWCLANGLVAEDYGYNALEALRIVASMRSGRSVAMDALKSDTVTVVQVAIVGLAQAKDETALPAIRSAFLRLGDRVSPGTIWQLALYDRDAADGVAFEFLKTCDRRYYVEQRAAEAKSKQP